MSSSALWLRSARFDVGFQFGALLGILPAVLVYRFANEGQAATFMPMASLFAVPLLHVFGSFFFAFSAERNQSPSRPAGLALCWVAWVVAALVLLERASELLATFALVYGGWHIFRQNFGFLRELAGRGRNGADRRLRRLDMIASATPAMALWLLISARGPWRFLGAEVIHLPIPYELVMLALALVPVSALLRILMQPRGERAAALLLTGNAVALLGPALFLDDLVLIYTLSASYHGIQYLAYLAERERERQPSAHPAQALLPLFHSIFLAMLGWFSLAALLALLAPADAERVAIAAWYAIVPFHYFVDGRIWKVGAARLHHS